MGILESRGKLELPSRGRPDPRLDGVSLGSCVETGVVFSPAAKVPGLSSPSWARKLAPSSSSPGVGESQYPSS
uniref:Uncharacterized protein n=1 Tax=Anguilla anguilla TaxID=7936 RepID=A0A0E9R392_ANGAN